MYTDIFIIIIFFALNILIGTQAGKKTKNLTNVRSSGTDRNLKITPHIEMSLEPALEYIEDDELVEPTDSESEELEVDDNANDDSEE